MNYRLGLDMGATSIGWCVLRLDQHDRPISVEDMGVRIFGDGRNAKDKQPLSVKRREHRSARRRRDRYVLRRSDLLRFLIRHGLMPEDTNSRDSLIAQDPLEIRARAITGQVSLFELGRALFHINKRRGFQSNRIADSRDEDPEVAGMKQGISRLREELGQQTLGQYLFERRLAGESVRMRPNRSGNKNEWDFYADRKMYMEEYDRIMEVQSRFHKELDEPLTRELRNIIFRQRPLRQPEPGWCALVPGERRTRSAFPSFQRFRVLQEINNLAIDGSDEAEIEISETDRLTLANILTQTFEGVNKSGVLTWARIRKTLQIQGKVQFNLERTGNKGIKCDVTSWKLSAEDKFAQHWFNLPRAQQESIVSLLLTEPHSSKLADRLQADYDVSAETSKHVSRVNLPKSYGRVSAKAIDQLMPHLEEGLTYDKACARAGLNHSNRHTGEIYDQGNLPYYGEVMTHHALGGSQELTDENPEARFGKINNPSVHIALNQLRKIINALYKRYRRAPAEIHIELARDLKNSPERLREIEKSHKKNRDLNDKIDEELEKLGITSNYTNRMKYKLWLDLAAEPDRRVCPFTGVAIPLSKLFTDEFEVEHLIPFSRSFDDGRANKVICTRKANRDKKNRTPFEAFGSSPSGYDWPAIQARIENLHHSKRWRFAPDAMERLKGEHETMISRLLTDTQYMSRVAREYMTYVLDDHNRVVCSSGRLTAKLRHHWGLNSLLSRAAIKERGDHRHHAIDALVVACTSRRNIQKLNSAASKAEEQFLDHAVKDLPAPFVDFNREQVQDLVDRMVISYKPDNSNPLKAVKAGSTKDRLHEETNWGLIGPSEREGFSIFATRTPITEIKPTEKSIREIAHDAIRHDLMARFSAGLDKGHWNEFLENYSREKNVKRVRIHREKSNKVMIPILDKDGEPYRYVQGGSIFCMDIWCSDKGKDTGKWQACPITMFDAHRGDTEPAWRKGNPTAWRVMRLHINDTVIYEDGTRLRLCRVKKTKSSGIVVLRDLRIAKESGDEHSWAASPNQLQVKNARRVWVDPVGRIHDAGKARKVELAKE